MPELNDSQFFEDYLKGPLSLNEKNELIKNKKTLIESGAFSGFPAFGTGGMRSVTGHGTNRLNRLNIARLAVAVSEVLKKNFSNNSAAPFIIGYDSRLTSEEYSRLTANILTTNGFNVKVFRRPTPTPLISYAVRLLNGIAGAVVTASHNPSQYNGFKVYWSDGGQIVPPIDGEIQREFDKIQFSDLPENVNHLAEKSLTEEMLIEEEIASAYEKQLLNEVFVGSGRKKLHILYSPLSGTGGWIFEKIFKKAGYGNFEVFKLQAQPDGTFNNVSSPNPEEPAAFTEMLKAADKIIKTGKTPPDLLLATDPDADRVGCAIRTKDGYQLLSGNQIGCLLLESIRLKKAKTLKSPFICKTIVTTQLQTKIAQKNHIRVIETLTGFKYIAEQVALDPENYLFGGEESFGYLPVSWVRDKDSISSGLAIAELAEKQPLIESLEQLYKIYGYYQEILINIKLNENEPEKMDQLRSKIKSGSALMGHQLGGRKVIDILDLQSDSQPVLSENQQLKKQLPSAEVMQWTLQPEGRLTIRPSGTEPKVKIYLSLKSEEKYSEKAVENLNQEMNLIKNDFLEWLYK